MSRYNHSDLIKRDPSGELHFVVWKVLKIIYAYVTTLLVRLDLKTGGGEIWGRIEGERMLHRRALSVQYNRDR